MNNARLKYNSMMVLVSIVMAAVANSKELKFYKQKELSLRNQYILSQTLKIQKIWSVISPSRYNPQKEKDSVNVLITIDLYGKLEKVVFDKVSDNQSLNIAASNAIFKSQKFDPPPLDAGKKAITFGIVFKP